MQKSGCINPLIMEALSLCGHGDQILIADGNYPCLSKQPPEAEIVYLGLRSGEPTVTDVLTTLLEEINVEAATVMAPDGSEPEIFDEFRKILPGIELKQEGRWEYYETAAAHSVRLVISTGEKRTFANILLTVGCA